MDRLERQTSVLELQEFPSQGIVELMSLSTFGPEEELALGGVLISIPAPVTDVAGAALIADALGRETKRERKVAFKWIVLGGAIGLAATVLVLDAVINSKES